jgi:hypothetical protein
MHADLGTGAGFEFHVSGNMIGVDVGFKDVGNFHPVGPSPVNVILDISLGIHDTGYSSSRATDEIRHAAHPINDKLFKIHTGLLNYFYRRDNVTEIFLSRIESFQGGPLKSESTVCIDNKCGCPIRRITIDHGYRVGNPFK